MDVMLTRLIPMTVSLETIKRDSGTKAGRITFGRQLSRRRQVSCLLAHYPTSKLTFGSHKRLRISKCSLNRRAKGETVKIFPVLYGLIRSRHLATVSPLAGYPHMANHASKRDLHVHTSCSILSLLPSTLAN